MPKKDMNQIAFGVAQQATGQAINPPESVKAVASRKGGLKGGKARADALSPDQRSAIARKAGQSRRKLS